MQRYLLSSHVDPLDQYFCLRLRDNGLHRGKIREPYLMNQNSVCIELHRLPVSFRAECDVVILPAHRQSLLLGKNPVFRKFLLNDHAAGILDLPDQWLDIPCIPLFRRIRLIRNVDTGGLQTSVQTHENRRVLSSFHAHCKGEASGGITAEYRKNILWQKAGVARRFQLFLIRLPDDDRIILLFLRMSKKKMGGRIAASMALF